MWPQQPALHQHQQAQYWQHAQQQQAHAQASMMWAQQQQVAPHPAPYSGGSAVNAWSDPNAMHAHAQQASYCGGGMDPQSVMWGQQSATMRPHEASSGYGYGSWPQGQTTTGMMPNAQPAPTHHYQHHGHQSCQAAAVAQSQQAYASAQVQGIQAAANPLQGMHAMQGHPPMSMQPPQHYHAQHVHTQTQHYHGQPMQSVSGFASTAPLAAVGMPRPTMHPHMRTDQDTQRRAREREAADEVLRRQGAWAEALQRIDAASAANTSGASHGATNARQASNRWPGSDHVGAGARQDTYNRGYDHGGNTAKGSDNLSYQKKGASRRKTPSPTFKNRGTEVTMPAQEKPREKPSQPQRMPKHEPWADWGDVRTSAKDTFASPDWDDFGPVKSNYSGKLVNDQISTSVDKAQEEPEPAPEDAADTASTSVLRRHPRRRGKVSEYGVPASTSIVYRATRSHTSENYVPRTRRRGKFSAADIAHDEEEIEEPVVPRGRGRHGGSVWTAKSDLAQGQEAKASAREAQVRSARKGVSTTSWIPPRRWTRRT